MLLPVAANIELAGADELDAPVVKQVGQHAVDDDRPHLAFDVIADDRQAAFSR